MKNVKMEREKTLTCSGCIKWSDCFDCIKRELIDYPSNHPERLKYEKIMADLNENKFNDYLKSKKQN
jgi:hypothetical protein